jgi:hypothetical protein
MVNLKHIGPRVKQVLKCSPGTRDNDNKLTAVIWANDLRQQGKDANLLTAQGFMKMYYDGKLTNAESIRRKRAEIQKLCPELRGEMYEKRRSKQDEIKKDLGYGN